jgi:hypothetical protein
MPSNSRPTSTLHRRMRWRLGCVPLVRSFLSEYVDILLQPMGKESQLPRIVQRFFTADPVSVLNSIVAHNRLLPRAPRRASRLRSSAGVSSPLSSRSLRGKRSYAANCDVDPFRCDSARDPHAPELQLIVNDTRRPTASTVYGTCRAVRPSTVLNRRR